MGAESSAKQYEPFERRLEERALLLVYQPVKGGFVYVKT